LPIDGIADALWDMPMAMFAVVSQHGFLLAVNPTWEQVLGYSPAELTSRPYLDFVHPDDIASTAAEARALLDSDHVTVNYENRYRCRDGSYRWLSWIVRADDDGDKLFAIVTDVTDAVTGRRKLADSERRYRLLAENATDVVWLLDGDGVLLWVSSSVEREWGWRPEQLLGTNVRELIHPDDRAATFTWKARLAAGVDVPTLESRRLAADGSYRWVSLRGRLVTHDNSFTGHMIIGMRDIHDEVTARASLAHAVEHDPLTGLATLSLAMTRIQSLLTEPGPGRVVGLLCVGVDSLQAVNEALSHSAGDRVLLAVATRIATVAGSPDLLARGSGDEFLILLPTLISGADASVIAEDVRMAAHGPVKVDNHHVQPTVSIGIATCGRGASPEQLWHDASLAMRQAKDKGRDRCEFFQARLATEAEHRLVVEAGIRAGLEQGQFVPWFQPVVNLADGTVVGYEALVRWVRPDGSISAPNEFLPVAERTTLIAEVDFVVLQKAVDVLAALPPPMHVAVNVSANTLRDANYAQWVVDALERSGAQASRLHLEFTETALLNVTHHVQTVMATLADLGVRWYVDDFGTGYSSIAHLRDLPVAGLKLDMSFTAGIAAGDHTSERLALALAGLADGLEMDAVAEGVETPEQAATLKAQGWKHAQGWLFGHPEPASVMHLL
jgi:diguanylate cyclase (GGDEF)-like protein/PAS domain S-box-containing protein